MQDIPKVKRSIDAFEKHGTNKFVIEYELIGASLSFLQSVFHVDPNHPDPGERYMIGSYDINEEQAKALQPYIKGKIDLKKFDFQLTCCSKD